MENQTKKRKINSAFLETLVLEPSEIPVYIREISKARSYTEQLSFWKLKEIHINDEQITSSPLLERQIRVREPAAAAA